MKTLLCVLALILGGCAGMNTQDANSFLSVDDKVQALSRTEVIAGISECEKAGMRPIIINAKRKINNQTVPAVVEVTCLPGFK
jgi:molybdenum cofactor biosynthesis enzyme MoaA